MKTALIRVAIALCAGLILTLTVSVLSSVNAPRPSNSTRGLAGEYASQTDAELMWMPLRQQLIENHMKLRWPDNEAFGTTNWTLTRDWLSVHYRYRPDPRALRSLDEAARQELQRNYVPAPHTIREVPLGFSRYDKAGWPLRCFEATSHWVSDSVTWAWAPIESDRGWLARVVAWALATLRGPDAAQAIVGDAALYDGTLSGRIIPLGVRLIPLLANTLFYAAFVLGVPWSYRLTVHQVRRYRGVCPGCGYDLTGLDEGAVCPECGKPTKETPP